MSEAASNEPVDRRRQILDAALEVFGTKGFHKATNKDIAEAAGGISPGLIYWYFKDKQDLLFAVIRDRATVLSIAEHPEQLLELPLHEGLTLIATSYLGIMRAPGSVAFLRIMLGEILRRPDLGADFYRLIVSKLFLLLRRYLDQQVEQGILRPHDTATSARSFIGMLIIQILAREIMRQPEAIATPDEQLVATIVDIFLNGLKS